MQTRQLAATALMAALLALCAWLTIPTVVPFTMQTFGIFLAVGVLGGKRGSLAVLVYLLMGIVGLPVFSGFTGGIGCLAGATGGYIVGFLLSALVVWAVEALTRSRKTWVLVLGMVLGLLTCYAFGTAWFMYFYARSTGPIGLATALGWCVFPYVVPDLVKIALALIIRKRLSAAIRIR